MFKKAQKALIVLALVATTGANAYKVIEIDLTKQKLIASEWDEVFLTSPISSGKRGHRTSKGKFKIIQKEKFHKSNKYPKPNGGAIMNYMLKFTSNGEAIHAGHLPGRPASHGCVRIPLKKAKQLFKWADNNTEVIVRGSAEAFENRKKARKLNKKRHFLTPAEAKIKRMWESDWT